MQSQVTSLTWRQAVAYAIVASVSAVLSPFVVGFFNRGESKAKIRNLDIQSTTTAGDLVLKVLQRLDDADANAHEIREELEDWKRKAQDRDTLKAANALLEQQLAESNLKAKYWESEVRKLR